MVEPFATQDVPTVTSATSPDNSAPEGPQVGAHGRVESEVSDADTALALGSGDVRVLGTPRVVALLEAAACAAIAGTLDPDRTTVGTQIEMRHLASSPIGSSVVAEARLEEFDGVREQLACFHLKLLGEPVAVVAAVDALSASREISDLDFLVGRI